MIDPLRSCEKLYLDDESDLTVITKVVFADIHAQVVIEMSLLIVKRSNASFVALES